MILALSCIRKRWIWQLQIIALHPLQVWPNRNLDHNQAFHKCRMEGGDWIFLAGSGTNNQDELRNCELQACGWSVWRFSSGTTSVSLAPHFQQHVIYVGRFQSFITGPTNNCNREQLSPLLYVNKRYGARTRTRAHTCTPTWMLFFWGIWPRHFGEAF